MLLTHRTIFVFFFFLNWHFGKYIRQFDTNWNSQEAKSHVAIKEGCTRLLDIFTSIKKGRNDALHVRERKQDWSVGSYLQCVPKKCCHASPCMYLHKWSSGFCACHVKNKFISCVPVDSNTAYAGWTLLHQIILYTKF